MMKRGSVIFNLVLLSLFLLSVNIISAETCTVRSSCLGGETEILGLSDTTNAHASLSTAYSYSLCCDWSASGTCTGSNTVLRLSDIDNAHAEIPSLSNYGDRLCYGDLSCTSLSGSCDANYPIEMISLSSDTNAHVGNFAAYNTKICCFSNPEAFCGDGTCGPGEICGYTDVYPLCNSDCGVCPPSCNNGVCDSGDCDICPQDCTHGECCGDGSCNHEEICGSTDLNPECNSDCGICLICSFTRAVWAPADHDQRVTDASTWMRLEGTNCEGQSVTFSIYEDDNLIDDLVYETTLTFGSLGYMLVNWNPLIWVDDDNLLENNPPEYYFDAVAGSGESLSSKEYGDALLIITKCGDGLIQSSYEQCDDGNEVSGDGCSSTCLVESGWGCIGEPSDCEPTTCELISAVWNDLSVTEGELVGLVVTGNNCDGDSVSFEVWEEDGFLNPDDPVSVNPNNVVFVGNTATGVWTAEFLDDTDGGQSNPPEYYFIATRIEDSSTIESSKNQQDLLIVTEYSGGFVCGNGLIEGTEECDDGDNSNGDGCSSNCLIESGWDCSGEPSVCNLLTEPCEITGTSWSDANVLENTIVNLIVTGTNCDGESVSFEVLEDDGFLNPDDPVTTNPSDVLFSGNTATGVWTAEFLDDSGSNGNGNPPEYYFIATSGADSYYDDTELLEVVQSNPQQCVGVNFCSNYDNQADCNSDVCLVGDGSVPEGITCGRGFDCGCTWNSGSSACEPAWEPWPNCGDGVINTGEQCDGTTWGSISSCTDFGFTDGTLGCNGCVFDTSRCTGGTIGNCGDGTVNLGEQCDGSVGGFLCSEFDDYNDLGSISCNRYCLLEVSLCEGGIPPVVPSIGSCSYSEQNDDDCEDGFLTRVLASTWTWDSGNSFPTDPQDEDYVEEPVGTWRFDPIINSLLGTRKSDDCADINDQLACPAQIKLPFFGMSQLIATVLLIAIIYTIIIFRKKKKDL